jgi:uncharacterized membrane protein HdeD (DUF308 family)
MKAYPDRDPVDGPSTKENAMLPALARNWWVVLLNGLAAIGFGILAIAWPGLTLLALVILFGVYCLADGITAIVASFAKNERGGSWWQMLLLGVVSILAGIAAFAWPGLTAIALVMIIAAWSVVHGIFEIVAAFELRKVIDNEWLLALAGVVSILFGIVLFARPGEGALTLVWVIGFFAIARGVLLVMLSFRLRGLANRVETLRAAAAV